MNKLDPLLHQELRLSIVSYLVSVDKADFNNLLEVTKASKGNLSVQLSKLEKASYIKIKKSFKGKYPHTSCSVTKKGNTAFQAYIVQLKEMLNL